jgi:predicted TIM-barrel fold metal-dependent hydrolase
MKPSDYFRRQMYACFWFEGTDDHLIDDIKRVGLERCMFETDFPHPTCLYPDPLTGIASTLEAVDYETRKMILGGNAAKVYNIDLPTG